MNVDEADFTHDEVSPFSKLGLANKFVDGKQVDVGVETLDDVETTGVEDAS